MFATALAVLSCAPALDLPAEIAEGLNRAGLHLKPASMLIQPAVTADQAVGAARQAFVANQDRGLITRVTLVAVSGPGNDRLGWDPRAHPLAYAVESTDPTTVGLVLVSAVTGEVLFVTAYERTGTRVAPADPP